MGEIDDFVDDIHDSADISTEKPHYHFCPICGLAVVCQEKRKGCLYLKNGERCTHCGGKWIRARDARASQEG
jgi:hypothetical protein